VDDMTNVDDETVVRALLAEHPEYDELAVRHSVRFRRVSNRYPHEVAHAYGGDLARAMADDDEAVATTVAAYERVQGREPQDWPALDREDEGRDEGREQDEP
jgi:hypothetical protein